MIEYLYKNLCFYFFIKMNIFEVKINFKEFENYLTILIMVVNL